MTDLKEIDFMPDYQPGGLLGLTADIVAAHISHNELIAEQLPTLIQLVYRALSTVDVPEIEPPLRTVQRFR